MDSKFVGSLFKLEDGKYHEIFQCAGDSLDTLFDDLFDVYYKDKVQFGGSKYMIKYYALAPLPSLTYRFSSNF